MILDPPPYRLIAEPDAPSIPGRWKSFIDPAFDTPMVRVTDATDGVLNRISYGIWPAFSCDYSKILIQCDGLFKIVTWNPSTMSDWGEIPLSANFQGVDATWSHTDPNVMELCGRPSPSGGGGIARRLKAARSRLLLS